MRPDILGTLDDIQAASRFVADDTTGMTWEEFEQDRKTRQIVERNFEIIGEAVNRLRKRDPAVAVRLTAHGRVVAFHDDLVHCSDTIDYQSLWRTIHESLPVLRAEVEEILGEQEDPLSAIEGNRE
jgi:uncharacterized protein with HEPN domain